MTFQLREVDRSKIYRSIGGQLIEGIRSGAFPPGSALPSERALALELGVSRGSVREAVRVLEHAGVLEVRTGSGNYVTEEALSTTTLLRLEAAATGQHSPLDIILVRRALEPMCARLAAAHRTAHELAMLKAAVDQHAKQLASGRDPTKADERFHVLLSAATHNTLLDLLMKQITAVMHEQMWSTMKHKSLAKDEQAAAYLHEHESILGFIETGDTWAAAKAMDDHLGTVEAGLLALTQPQLNSAPPKRSMDGAAIAVTKSKGR
jgi:GntR family transcriptional repressor for pyruvate dehydrogenase complex